MEPNAIFVYGSLKRGYLRGQVWPHKPISIREGIVAAKLFDLGPYPGIVVSEVIDRSSTSDWVLGELWTVAIEDLQATLETLDDVEEYVPGSNANQYVRKVVVVELEDKTSVEAFTYEYANRDYIETCRRIMPDRSFDGLPCAAWPDRLARVPKSFQDE